MYRAVLFDLDGTLLDLDLNAFLREYFGLLGPVVAKLVGSTPEQAVGAVMKATDAMVTAHPGKTNAQAFHSAFRELTGTDLSTGRAAETLVRFYDGAFPSLLGDKRPREGGLDALRAAEAMGAKRVIATNPIFPRTAIDERARWAEVNTAEVDFITSYENSYACKPQIRYFSDIAKAIGMRCEDCLMVGDDPDLDMGAKAAGMATFYVGAGEAKGADYSGDMIDVAQFLQDIADPYLR
ncbi:MAG: HAD family hydrolase [Coriobacteriia bacterium]|nr:HAD family hydrolase [Coriobacteriia bacterium]